MSQSIGIPGFVNERKDEINALSRFKDERKGGSRKRDRITMYRTRSFMRYGMSRAVRQRRMQSPVLYSVVSAKPKMLYRRQRRVPGLLQNSFAVEPEKIAQKAPAIAARDGKTTAKPKKGKRCASSNKQVVQTAPSSTICRLNTHMWHVKRFFMTSAFSWSIPVKHRNRGLKAVDSLLEECVLQDISYFLAAKQAEPTSEGRPASAALSSMVLSGLLQDVTELLRAYTDPRAHLVDADEDAPGAGLAEAVETEVLLFERGRFPAACIGPASLLFVPQPGSGGSVQVWVSCHPAIASTVYEQLSAHDGDCTVGLVPPRFNRFRVRGQEACKALLALLRCPLTSAGTGNEGRIRYLRALLSLKSPSKHIAPGQVVAVDVLDPREVAGTSAATDAIPQGAAALINKRPASLGDSSSLFGAAQDKFCCPKDHLLNGQKHKQKVQNWHALFATTEPFPSATSADSAAGTKNAPAAVCPMLLIRQEAESRRFHTRVHQLSGWDVLVPAAWGGVMFAALQLRGGAAVVGYEEMEHLQAKTGVTSFPRDFPDTATGRRYWEERHRSSSEANAKRPPRKQVLVTPLAGPLLEAGGIEPDTSDAASSSASGIHEQLAGMLIVRGESYLKEFRPPLYEDLERAQIEETQREIAAHAEDAEYTWVSPYIVQLPKLPALMFLQVLLIPTCRGMVHDLAEIVLPTAADVTAFVEHKVNTQRKRDGKRATEEAGRAARQLQEAAKHKGLYGRQVDEGARESTQHRADPDLDRNWPGVKLTSHRLVPCDVPTVSGQESASTPAVMDVEETPATEGKGLKNGKKAAAKSKARRNFVDFEIGRSEGRRVIGTVTSGQQAHLNNTHFAVGLCNVNALNELFRRSYGRYAHPQAHLLVLFRNGQSDWLRPAVLQII